jgi:hypothetical protein
MNIKNKIEQKNNNKKKDSEDRILIIKKKPKINKEKDKKKELFLDSIKSALERKPIKKKTTYKKTNKLKKPARKKALLKFLSENGWCGLDISKLARAYGVARGTIYSDLNELLCPEKTAKKKPTKKYIEKIKELQDRELYSNIISNKVTEATDLTLQSAIEALKEANETDDWYGPEKKRKASKNLADIIYKLKKIELMQEELRTKNREIQQTNNYELSDAVAILDKVQKDLQNSKYEIDDLEEVIDK